MSERLEKFDASAIAQRYRPEDRRVAYEFPGGEIVWFEIPLRKSELDELYQSAAIMAAKVPIASSDNAEKHRWRQWLPVTETEAREAALIHLLSAPDTKIDYLAALQFLHAPMIFTGMWNTLNVAMKTASGVRMAQMIEESKKNLIQTVLEESSCDALTTSSESTSTPSAKKKKNSSRS